MKRKNTQQTKPQSLVQRNATKGRSQQGSEVGPTPQRPYHAPVVTTLPSVGTTASHLLHHRRKHWRRSTPRLPLLDSGQLHLRLELHRPKHKHPAPRLRRHRSNRRNIHFLYVIRAINRRMCVGSGNSTGIRSVIDRKTVDSTAVDLIWRSEKRIGSD